MNNKKRKEIVDALMTADGKVATECDTLWGWVIPKKKKRHNRITQLCSGDRLELCGDGEVDVIVERHCSFNFYETARLSVNECYSSEEKAREAGPK